MRARDAETTRRTWHFETVETLEREIYLLLQHVSGELIHELYTLLKPAGITPEQYHVLRILRDAGSEGTPLSAIAERSPVGDPDVTGLLDRLETRGLARRARDADDRRLVIARITAKGRRLLGSLDEPVAALHARQLGPLGERGLRELRRLLQSAAAVGPV
ncbi:MAG TPA: MarR family transcriptional regulator [Gemmatimonadaceae bacterium]|nr:MarR family transcriptional regulator [Gemmatimonadaceae bacterium]